MSSFLAGVVRRGAGLASPVAMRPALGPQQIPLTMSMPSADTRAESDGEHARKLPEPAIQTVVSTPSTVTSSSAFTQERVRPAAAPPAVVMQPAAAGVPVLRSDTTPLSEGSHSSKIVSPNHEESMRNPEPRSTAMPLPAAEAARSAHASPPGHPTRTARIAPALTPATLPAADAPSKHREQKQEAPIMPTAQAGPSSAAVEKRATEPPNIQVRIGKVEIRSTAPAPSITVARPPAKGGFDDYTLARNYLDRSAR